MLRTPRKASAGAGASPNNPQTPSTLYSPSGLEPLTTTSNPNPSITSALNKTVNSSTGIYQQSVYLRSRLHRLPAFSSFLDFSQSGPRASKDVVTQLWETLSLGKPLCVLFNLQDLPSNARIAEYCDMEVDPDPLRKERQRAVALFVMGVNTLKGLGLWEKDAPIFSIGELVRDAMDTNGFVKVVATVLYLLDKLPSSVWSDDVQQVSDSTMPSHESLSSMASREDMERANIVRELIETERKYCQDLETMQSYAESLRQSGIEDADTVHKLFPALGKLTDFQRKLLIGMEATAEHSLDEQDWGHCFVKHEPEFAIYDAYIANYSQALDLALAEQATLMAASNIINPLQLPAFLIKPVQRLCRYPMLLSSLLKLSSEDRPLHGSLVDGVAAVKRIADMANRALREKENEETLKTLLSRVKDWKGLQLDSTGPLLLDDVFGVVGDRRSYTEYHAFLFNRMLLLCRPKDAPTDTDSPEKEKEKGDWLTNGFKKSYSSSSLAVTVLPPTPKSTGTSAFLAGGAIASRRAKTPFSIRGALYIRNIVEITAETSLPYALHIKYQDRSEVNNWTLQCRNDEQVNLWHDEIQRLLRLWEIEEAEIRRNAQLGINTMTEQMGTYSSHESLDITSLESLRSARRPAHPFAATFGSLSSKARSRSRNGSLNLVDGKPGFKFGRSRSSSVSSVASDVLAPKEEVATDAVVNVANSVSFPPRPSSRQDSSISVRSEMDESPRDRTASQNPEAYIDVQLPPPTMSRTPLTARIRTGPLPPQPPPPTGPAPPRPDETPYFFPYERRTHSRQSSAGSENSIRPLPAPPLSLRERVGDRMPAPLMPLNLTPVTPSGQTPQSTLPELPSKDLKRPMSHRKTSTPIRGPRERTAATPTSGYLDAAPEIRSRVHSNSSINPGQTDSADLSTSTHSDSNRKLLPRRPRRGSESSSTTDSVSLFASSEDQSQDTSPITPDSLGEEGKQSPSKASFQPTHKRTGSGSAPTKRPPVRVESLILSPRASRRQADLLSAVTPKTAFHETRDKEAIKSGGLTYPKTPSDSVISPVHGSSARSHSRNNSASGLGRTLIVNEPAMVTVRLHHEGSKFLLKLSYAASRRDFIDKVRRKIRLSTNVLLPPAESLPPSYFASEENVSYLNEKNKFVPLESDHDFSMAWNSVNSKRPDPNDEGILILAVGNTEHLTY